MTAFSLGTVEQLWLFGGTETAVNRLQGIVSGFRSILTPAFSLSVVWYDCPL